MKKWDDFIVDGYRSDSNEKIDLLQNVKSVEHNLEALGFRPAVYSPYYKLIKKKDVDLLHEMDIMLIPWTVNDIEDMERLKELGVDGLITDYPDRAAKAGLTRNQ